MFPAEILPIVTVLANLVHFLLGLPILVLFLIYFDAPLQTVRARVVSSRHMWSSCFSASGSHLILSALTVHFRDLKDILANVMTLWFFATPIIYYWKFAPPAIRRFLDLNPFTHLAISIPGNSVFPWRLRSLEVAARARGSVPCCYSCFAYFLFDRHLRDSFRGGSVTVNAIEVTNVTKVYRRYATAEAIRDAEERLIEGQPHSGPSARGDVPGPAGRVLQRRSPAAPLASSGGTALARAPR